MSAIWSASSRTVISIVVERAGAALDEVAEPARRGDEHVDAALQARRSAGRTARRRRPCSRNRPIGRASGRSASATCIASSRVGTRMRARGWCGRAGSPSASRASTGRPKASVLPEPVWPRPSTSRPASASGMVAVWIANGVVMPSRRSARTSGARHAERRRRSGDGVPVGGVEGGRERAGISERGQVNLSAGGVSSRGPAAAMIGRRVSPQRTPKDAQMSRAGSVDLVKCTGTPRASPHAYTPVVGRLTRAQLVRGSCRTGW